MAFRRGAEHGLWNFVQPIQQDERGLFHGAFRVGDGVPLFLTRGLAHGYCVLSDVADSTYQMNSALALARSVD